MADITALLQQLGFSAYEARTYLAFPARMYMRCCRS